MSCNDTGSPSSVWSIQPADSSSKYPFIVTLSLPELYLIIKFFSNFSYESSDIAESAKFNNIADPESIATVSLPSPLLKTNSLSLPLPSQFVI